MTDQQYMLILNGFYAGRVGLDLKQHQHKDWYLSLLIEHTENTSILPDNEFESRFGQNINAMRDGNTIYFRESRPFGSYFHELSHIVTDRIRNRSLEEKHLPSKDYSLETLAGINNIKAAQQIPSTDMWSILFLREEGANPLLIDLHEIHEAFADLMSYLITPEPEKFLNNISYYLLVMLEGQNEPIHPLRAAIFPEGSENNIETLRSLHSAYVSGDMLKLAEAFGNILKKNGANIDEIIASREEYSYIPELLALQENEEIINRLNVSNPELLAGLKLLVILSASTRIRDLLNHIIASGNEARPYTGTALRRAHPTEAVDENGVPGLYVVANMQLITYQDLFSIATQDQEVDEQALEALKNVIERFVDQTSSSNFKYKLGLLLSSHYIDTQSGELVPFDNIETERGIASRMYGLQHIILTEEGRKYIKLDQNTLFKLITSGYFQRNNLLSSYPELAAEWPITLIELDCLAEVSPGTYIESSLDNPEVSAVTLLIGEPGKDSVGFIYAERNTETDPQDLQIYNLNNYQLWQKALISDLFGEFQNPSYESAMVVFLDSIDSPESRSLKDTYLRIKNFLFQAMSPESTLAFEEKETILRYIDQLIFSPHSTILLNTLGALSGEGSTDDNQEMHYYYKHIPAYAEVLKRFTELLTSEYITTLGNAYLFDPNTAQPIPPNQIAFNARVDFNNIPARIPGGGSLDEGFFEAIVEGVTVISGVG